MQIEINETELQLLREAASEFIWARGGLEGTARYVAQRYPDQDQQKHIVRVKERVAIMYAIYQKLGAD